MSTLNVNTTTLSSISPSPFLNVDPISAAALLTSTNTTAIYDTSDFRDPLRINLRKQITRLLDLINQKSLDKRSLYQRDITVLQSYLNEKQGKTNVLDAVSRMLSVPCLVESVMGLFRPLVIDLVTRWLNEEEDALKEERLCAFAYLVEVYEEIFPIFFEFLTKFYPRGPLSFVDEEATMANVDSIRLHQLLLAYTRIQHTNGELPVHVHWSLSPLHKLICSQHHNNGDNGIKLLAIRCYAFQSGMGEAEREKLERNVLGFGEEEVCGVDCWVYDVTQTEGIEEGAREVSCQRLDGWMIPVLEGQRIKRLREALKNLDIGNEFYDAGEESDFINESDLSLHVANIHGVLLFKHSILQPCSSLLVQTPVSIKSLRALALHISMRVPTLLTSTPSAGKSLLLNHIAGILHPGTKNQIITIHLADTSLDPRSLLGSYISSSTHPGNFEWRDGVLVRAMREGRWVVFEDIDRGSNEVLGTIKPLIESLRLESRIGARAKLSVPSRGTIVAHHNFLVFATRSVHSRNGQFPQPTFFGAHKFCETIVRAPEGSDLKLIVEKRCSKLKGVAVESLIDLWDGVRLLGTASGVRDVGLRELEKFCRRVERLLPGSWQPMDADMSSTDVSPLWNVFTNPSLREEIYLEARDVFFGSGATTSSAQIHLDMVAKVIGEKLGLDEERRAWLIKGRTPMFEIEKDVNGNVAGVIVGRTRLVAKQKKGASEDLPPSRPFAMHRPAKCLLSSVMTSIALSEPVLLTGETGTGKTSVITHLASLLGRSLISLNLSHQTESSDLVGGLKPVDTRVPASALHERFLELFGATFSRKKNEKFESEVRKAVNEARWKRVVGLWRESGRLAKERLATKQIEPASEPARDEPEGPRKRRRVDPAGSATAWARFLQDVDEFEVQHVQGKGKFAFGFVEGPLVKALRSGDWILLDEINLASPETLECISGLLHGPTASITLTEQGSLEPVPRHPEFRLFACMNPATDVGKKDLPPNIRSRFTEIDVPSPDADKETLLSIIHKYIGACAAGDKAIIMNVAEFYIAVKDLVAKRQLADGVNHRPHFSMRTLARALTFAADMASQYSLRRSVWEGCIMAFTMVLDSPSAETVMGLMCQHLLVGVKNQNPKSMLSKNPSVPHGSENYIKFGPFYLERGPYPEDSMEEYIMTPSVETKLVDLARIITTRRFPVLIEGPTSSGKTSSVEYLARRTGHRFVRINNHEHTDIQEYLGSYVSDPLTGKLVFKDGLLVHALRNGDWIVLDELNLAPTDVLEALNRLLDDNRELVIPETQEVVRPHPQFMLFATQNPPGLYAGRKVLSRAFRNRFLEVHFQDVPQAELESILCQRCRIAPSYGKRIVAVFRELQKRRQAGRVFESKQAFATLRDLFRWANRDAVSYQELADNGYMLLAERTRREDDKAVVKEVIQSIMGVQINETTLYNLQRADVDMLEFLGVPLPSTTNIIWTKAMQRLYILVCRALRFNEPVLLVGETGSGKTSVCQVFADATGQRLHGLNCHQNTETADIIGALRPIRNRTALEADVFQEASLALASVGVKTDDTTFNNLSDSLNKALKLYAESADHGRLATAQERLLRLQSIFEWHDGPLVEAMRNGDVFLLDEISLADDSVLERLNSVLESGRTIVLAEKGGSDSVHPTIQANNAFKLVATMNPGGDYGKKELSPALRNRFTEIWVPRVDDRLDLEMIVDNMWRHDDLKLYTTNVLDYTGWLATRIGDKSITSLRDIIAWVMFSNAVYKPGSPNSIPPAEIFHHAAQMTYLDGLSSLPQLSAYSRAGISQLKDEATRKLQEMVPLPDLMETSGPVYDPSQFIQLGSFAIRKGSLESSSESFNLTAPTSRNNAMRILRACQLPKPILLEGSPGVGKTSLVMALANISGHHLCRINLSDQTDLIDLFGSDLPVEGGAPGEFAWRDAEFLRALQEGHWVLLDEMNLAPQAVLEGLNAVLDHRGTVYIPELGKSFSCHPSFRIFAAQNPVNQGGGRKGLPKSFVNRFTKVYVDELTPTDLTLVCEHLFPRMDKGIVRAMISFNSHLSDEVTVQRLFGRQGTPWEFNLRDVIRWGTLLSSCGSQSPVMYLRSIYLQRFREHEDRIRAQRLFDTIFVTPSPSFEQNPSWSISSSHLQIGHFSCSRRNFSPLSGLERILKSQLAALEALGDCVSQGWLAIVTGLRDSGKSHLVRVLADYTGNPLREISINSATDTMDIIGSFEQVDVRAQVIALVHDTLAACDDIFRNLQGSSHFSDLLAMQDVLRLAVLDQGSENTLASLLEQASALVAKMAESSPSPLIEDLTQRLQSLFSAASSIGRFEWVDGPLIQAMRKGDWLLLDGANLCSPSVLDRLNSLCEPGGQLTLNERGLVNNEVETLKPHPNFRLFMTVDPHLGELSRAMRNRGIEIFLPTGLASDDYFVLLDHLRLTPLEISADHFNLLCLKQQSLRRGLLQPVLHFSNISAYPRHSLSPFSALANVMDRFPLYLTTTSNIELDATTFFFSRTFHPAYMPYCQRTLVTCCDLSGELRQDLDAFMGLLSHPPFSSIIKNIHKTALDTNNCAFEILYTQAMDDLVNGSLGTLDEVDRKALLDVLDFFTAIFLENKGQRKEHETNAIPTHSTESVLSSIKVFLGNLSRLNEHLLQSLATSVDLSPVLSRVLAMNKQGLYLRLLASQDTLDHSAVHVVANLISQTMKDAPSTVHGLINSTRSLLEITSLKSGTGLVNMWSKWNCTSALALRPQVAKIVDLTIGLPRTKTGADLRRQSLRTIASLSLSLDGSSHEVVDDIISVLQGHPRTLLADTKQILPVMPHVSELALLSTTLQGKIPELERFLDVVSRIPGESLVHYVAVQQLDWSLEENKDVSARFIHTVLQWLQSVWSSKEVGSGANDLLQPSQLLTALRTCHLEEVNLNSMEIYEKDVSLWVDITLLESYQARNEQLHTILRETLRVVTRTLDDIPVSDTDDLEAILDILVKRSNIRPTFATFQKGSETQTAQQLNLQKLGLAWVTTGVSLLELLIPDAPVDPVAIHNTMASLQQRESHQAGLEILLHQSLEKIKTGNNENFILSVLHQNVASINVAAVRPLSVLGRSDITQLHAFWTEVRQFAAQVVPENKIYDLLQSLIVKTVHSPLREQVFQESITGFCQRLETAYPQFQDLNMLLGLALSHLRLGVRLVAKASVIHPEAEEIADLLVRYPSVCTTSAIIGHGLDEKPTVLSPFNYVNLKLVGMELEASLGGEMNPFFVALEAAYNQVLGLWLVDQAKVAGNEAASASLYRGSIIEQVMMTDAEVEEQEFLALFPSFEDTATEDTTAATSTKSSLMSNITHESMVLIANLHLDMFSSPITTQAALGKLHQVRKDLLTTIFASHCHDLSATLDTAGLAYRLRFLNESKDHYTKSVQDHATYNFYKDPNLAELRRASEVVTTLRTHLKKLFEEWPEQMVLQHLMDRCDLILGLTLDSPVAKILTTLEQLLVHTDDWEMYANRDNSLALYRHELTDLIVRWRRLELQCWAGLLQSESQGFSNGAAEWWFRLYDATIRGFLSAVESNDTDNYLAKLVPLLDEFLATSPLGQYTTRMQLMKCFAHYILKLSDTKINPEQNALRRVVAIISSTLRYYQLFESSLVTYLAEQRKILNKEIKDFIKLASWKDINVHALKQSAQKTHHQLYKVIRKFREVLREPISSRLKIATSIPSDVLLSSYNTIRPERHHTVVPEGLASSSNPLAILRSTFGKFETLVESRICNFINRSSHDHASDFASTITEISKELSEIPIPSGLTSEKRTKYLKTILVRKRKALSDLLKKLKKLGLSGNVKADVLRRNNDVLWLNEQPILAPTGVVNGDIEKAETSFARLRSSIPELRLSLSSHHSDLQTRELQRGVSFLESGFALAIDLRARLASELDSSLKLEHIFTRLSKLISPDSQIFNENIKSQIGSISRLMCHLSCMLIEISGDVKVFDGLQTLGRKPVPFEDLETHLQRSSYLMKELNQIHDDLHATPVPALRMDERNIMLQSLEFFTSCIASLEKWSTSYPHLQYLFVPAKGWLCSQEAIHIQLEPSTMEQDNAPVDSLLNTLLYTIQVMVTESNTPEQDEYEEEDEQQLIKGYRRICNFSQLLSLKRIIEQLNVLLTQIATEKTLNHVLQCIIPFLEVYQVLVREQLVAHARWMKGFFKLDLTLCSVLLTLAKQGFCQPPESEEGGDGEGEAMEADGTGLGEGTGQNNVSKEIEDESQVEGLKGEDEAEKDKNKNNEDDDALEMSEDIAGALEDVPEGDEEDADDKSDGESEADPDERIEDLDPADPSALDEKIWGDESGPQDSEDAEDKTGKDHSEEQSGSSEVVAKENNEKSKGKENEKEKPGDQEESNMKEEDEEAPEAEERGEEEEGDPDAAGAPMEDYLQDTNALDLPDDMDLDNGEEDKGDNGPDEDDLGDDEVGEDDTNEQVNEADGREDDAPFDKQDIQQDTQRDVSPEQMEEEEKEEEMEMDNAMVDNVDEQPDPEQPEETSPPEEVTARPEISAGESDANVDDQTQAQDQAGDSTGQAGSSAANAGQNTASEDKVRQQTGSHNEQQEQSTEEAPDSAEGNATTGMQEGQKQSTAEQKAQTNPLRSLGDTLKEIRQRFDEILESEAQNQPKENTGPSDAPPQLEYLQPEDVDHEMQALGPAGEEQVAKLDDLMLLDEDNQPDPAMAMDVDEDMEPEQHQNPLDAHTSQAEQNGITLREKIEGAVLPGAPSHQESVPPTDATLSKADVELEEDFGEKVEAELRQWHAAGFPDAQAEHIWRLYESLTHGLAYALCEQLRLILEPTLATRLKGEFRTGKRLNMKKIIPYIASDYTKDKIWLRRTKPSQREYQVLIAIDDSRSMAESHSVHLAYQTLALISKALGRLEAGDIAIAKFGGSVDILHGFDQGPFTDQAGTQVVNAFTFDQKATNVLSLVDTSLKVLETAREQRSMSSTSAADLWQLEIIISDGICQDHEQLKILLRKAEEQKVMIVFIIIDSLHSSIQSGTSSTTENTNSILTMTKADFKTVDGRMEMQLVKYLDSFPFEYYVVLRDVEALPEVLSGTLKQFFERVSGE